MSDKFVYSMQYYPCFWYKPSEADVAYWKRHRHQVKRKLFKMIRNGEIKSTNDILSWELDGMTVGEFCLLLLMDK